MFHLPSAQTPSAVATLKALPYFPLQTQQSSGLDLSIHCNPSCFHKAFTPISFICSSPLQVLCLWDISSQLCLQRLAGSFPKTQEDAHTSLFLCEERQLLLLSFNSQLIMLETVKEERRTSSHEHSVTCVLYNSLFRQVSRVIESLSAKHGFRKQSQYKCLKRRYSAVQYFQLAYKVTMPKKDTLMVKILR